MHTLRPFLAGIATTLVLTSASAASQEASNPELAQNLFASMKALEGQWEGTAIWSGGRSGTQRLTATYRLTGGGSALVETLQMGPGATSMTTVYHLDDGILRMTHYCLAGNQPRLRAAQIAPTAKSAVFGFVDATNLARNPAHVKRLSIELTADHQVKLRFTFGGGNGPDAIEEIALQRLAR